MKGYQRERLRHIKKRFSRVEGYFRLRDFDQLNRECDEIVKQVQFFGVAEQRSLQERLAQISQHVA